MQHNINLREANQQLARYIRAVEAGDEVVITRRGRPVARLIPFATEPALNAEQGAALERTLKCMEHGYPLGRQKPRREELHER